MTQPLPVDAEAAYQRGFSLHRQGSFAEARLEYERALRIEPRHFQALHLCGVLELQMGRPRQAMALIREALAVDPYQAAAHLHYANALLGLEQREAALASYDRALALKPDSIDAHYNRGIVLRDLGRCAAAVDSYDRAIALHPRHVGALNNRALALADLGRHEEALASLDRALAIDPGNAEIHLNRGNSLRELGRLQEAIASFTRAVELRGDYAQAYNNRGLASCAGRRPQDALADFDRAIAIEPRYAAAFFNRGNALRSLSRLESAVSDYDRAIALEPSYRDAHVNLGVTWRELGRPEQARRCFERVIGLDPAFAEGHVNLAVTLSELHQYEAAIASFDRAVALDSTLSGNLAAHLYAKMQICDWRDFEPALDRLRTAIDQERAPENPFCLLSLVGSARLQHQAARAWVDRSHPANGSLGDFGRRRRGDRIRVAYFSADFRDHPVAMLLAGLLDRHDRTRFESFGISFRRGSRDDMALRMERAFERFIDVREKSDLEIASLARELQIDIAVDLGGFTQGSRPGIFALRAAPVQISHLGYAGTMGAPYIDYLIADETVISAGSEGCYQERIVRLPGSFMPYDSARPIAAPGPSRARCGLPEEGFVYCCFNNMYKLSPESFAGWMRILRRTPGSVLWLSAGHPSAIRNLRQAAGEAQVDPQRLRFAERLAAHGEHLARLRHADLFLDTLPYNAHATAADALWAGLPVLTRLGEAFAGRVAGSLLEAVGLPELITTTSTEYEDLAVELALDRPRLADLRRRLADNRISAPLFDTRGAAANLESAYEMLLA